MVGADSEQHVHKTHRCDIGIAQVSFDRHQEALMGKTRNGGNESIRNSYAVGSIDASLLHSFHGLPQAAPEADGNDEVAFAAVPCRVRTMSRRYRGRNREPEAG